MNAFCPNLSNKQVKQEFEELVNIFGEDVAYFLWDKNNGYSLDRAPNGALSQLFSELMDYYKGDRQKAFQTKAKVYFSAFKNWFGDWQSENKDNVSKIVDSNGEPKIMWHGTDQVFDTFELDLNHERGTHKVHPADSGFFFTDTQSKAFKYKNDITIPVFLNFRNPGFTSVKTTGNIDNTKAEIELFHNDNYDSSIIERYDKESKATPTKQWIAKTPNQIKHIDNVGTFYSTDNNMYRYESKPNKYLGVRFHNYMRDNGYLDVNGHPTPLLMRRVAVYGYKSQKQMSLILNAIRSIIVNNNLEFNPDDVHYDGRTYRITYNDTSSKKDKSLFKDLFDGYYVENGTGYITVDAEQMINNLIKRGKSNSFLIKLYKLLKPAIVNTRCRINLLDEGQFYRRLNRYGYRKSTAAYYDSDTNTIYVNKDAIFIDNSGKTKNRADTTILHELIHAITVDAVRKSKPLYDEILQIIENVKSTIGESEAEKWYGLTGVAEFLAELSNYDFCRLLAGVKIKDKNIILSALQKIKDVLTDVYKFLKSLIGKDVKLEQTELGHAFDVLYRAAYSNVHDESLEAVSNFDNTIFAQQSSDNTDELHKRVIELTDKIENLFGQLYRRYEKQSNATVARSKTKDELFEKIQELKTLRGVDEIKCIIDYGLNQLGVDVYEVNGEQSVGSNNTILHYLKNNQDKDINPRFLIDIKDNILNFYDILLSDKMLGQRIQVDGNLETIVDAVLRKDSKDQAKEYHDKFEVLKQSVETINLLWNQALYKASDNIVDRFIDENLSFDQERKEMLKLTTKEWLHRNQLEGFFDIPLLMYWVYNFETSRSPVVRQMFHMISQAKQRTVQEALPIQEMLSKLFDKANTVDKIFSLGNWQTMLMEKDRDGNYTGNFVSDINRGQYLKDQTEYTEKLNAAMIETFGFTYIRDNMTGVIKRSDTETPIDDEEWDSAPYRYWQEHRERWMCAHANRRYTLNYYLERMSQPYSKTNKKGHGLSPKTLAAYNKVQSQINYYLDKSVDVETGYAHPEDLDPQDKQKLKYLYDQLKELSSLFTADGYLKKDDEYDVAMEIISWQTYINKFLSTTIDWDAYNQELNSIEDEQKRNEFVYWNSQIGVNPSYLALAYDGKRDDENNKELQYLKQSMVSIVKHNREYTYDLSNVQNNMMFFLACKAVDEAQEQIKRKKRAAGLFNQPPTTIIKGRKYDSDDVENTSYLFNDVAALYINPDGQFVQTPDGAYITWFDYIIDHLTNLIINNGYKIQISADKFKTFDTDGLDDKQIKMEIEQWLRYQLSYEEERSIGGQLYYSRVPISIFMVKKPTVDQFFNEETEQWEDTIVNVPKGRFKTKYNRSDDNAFKFINEDYDIRNPESIQPKKELYDNHEQFDIIKSDKNVYDYYKAIIDIMGKYYSSITGQKYMYRMPQLDADNIALMSRHKKLPIVSTLLKYFTGITSRDFDKRSEEEYKDFSDLNTSVVLPRLMKSLEDPNTISSDILNSVSMFVQYAIDYKNNSEIQPILEVLKYALMDKTERTNPAAGERQAQQAFELLTRYLYGDDWRWNNQGGDSKVQIAAIRAARLASSAASRHMLGGNVLSMGAGAVSSLYSSFRQAGVGKYFTFKELLTSVCDVIKQLPQMIINVGEQNVNTKVGALMRRFGISVNTTTMFKNKYQSRLRKLVPQLAMGGFSAVDYTINCILLSSVLRHYRFYDGDVIKKGFYTRDELEYLFKDKGLTEKDAKNAFAACSTTLYNAYKYNSDGRIAQVKKQFKPYVNAELETLVSKTVKQRVAVNNGVSTDDDMSKASQNKIFAIVSAMRNFIWQTAQSMYVGGEDFILPQTEDTEEYNVVGGATSVKKKKVKVKLTQEQKQMRGVVNYAGGRAQFQDDFVRSAYRAICLGLGKLFNYTKYKNRKFSKPEKYAIRHFAMLLSVLAASTYIQINLDDWAFKKNRGTDWASAAIADTHLRGLVQIQSEFDVSTLNELINTTTVYSTAVKEKAGITDYFWNMTPWSDKQNTSIVTSGSYKGSTLGQRTLFRFTGILDNIHTSFTTQGVKSNYDFYTKMYGKTYKTLGYPLGTVRYSGPSLSKMNQIDDDFDKEFNKTEKEFEKFDDEFDNMDF